MTVKRVHGLQNDGQQKELFYKDSDNTRDSTGCGERESRTHFTLCKATHLQASHIKGREGFQQTHGKVKTAKVIYDAFMRICISLRLGDAPPSSVTHFDSAIDRMVQQALDAQRAIGWDQILKGGNSKHYQSSIDLFDDRINILGNMINPMT